MGKNKGKNGKVLGASGLDAFNVYYGDIFGVRWSSLRAALMVDPQYITIHYNDPLLDQYYIGRASALVGLLTPVKRFDCVLDMCAAPGGKTLLLLRQSDIRLFANDISSERVFRLKSVIKTCVPSDIAMGVKVTCQKAQDLCLKSPAFFDTILLDAPCSSERHVLNSPKYIRQWTASRVKALSMEQYALLSAARLAVKNGGYIMYSTCALAPAENDGVIDRLLQKHSDVRLVYDDNSLDDAIKKAIGDCAIISDEDKSAIGELVLEKTKYGYAIMCDENDGSGPMYFSLLQKLAEG